jgi:RHS repeat-associated protein
MKETNPDPNNYEGEDVPSWEFYFYTINGQRLVTIDCNNANSKYQPNCWPVGENTYFGKKLLVSNGVYVVTDRRGTVRANTQGESFAYYPFGEERTSTVDGRDKFATYFRDTVGLDYAQQRYYNSSLGRFWSLDPGGIRTAHPGNPTSWNRYGYVNGDPVNKFDPTGREDQDVDPEGPDPGDPADPDPSDGGGGTSVTSSVSFPAQCQNGEVSNGAVGAPGNPTGCDTPLPPTGLQVLGQAGLYLNSVGVGGFVYGGPSTEQGPLEGTLLGVVSYDSNTGWQEAGLTSNSFGPIVSSVSVGNEYSSSGVESLTFVGFNTGQGQAEAGFLFSLGSGTVGFYGGYGDVGGGFYLSLGGTTITAPGSGSSTAGGSSGCSVVQMSCAGGK